MDRPPPIGRVFSLYFRFLLAALALALLFAVLAVKFNWPAAQTIDDYLREQTAHRSPPKSTSR